MPEQLKDEKSLLIQLQDITGYSNPPPEKFFDIEEAKTALITTNEQIAAVNNVMTVVRSHRLKAKPKDAKEANVGLFEQVFSPLALILVFFFVLFSFLCIYWAEYSRFNMAREFGNGLCVSRTYYTQRNCEIIY